MPLVLFCSTTVSLKAQSYVKFNNKPIEAWDSILEQSGVERHYSVQRGDTLYGISKTLFGDASFWPKIWSLNSMITNPHQIEKGQTIYFTGGTVIRPPRFGMDIIQSQRYTYGSGFLKPEIPPDPLVKDIISIPPSFTDVFKVAGDVEAEKKQLESISAEKRSALSDKRKILITSEIVSKKPSSAGSILRAQDGGASVMKDDLVYISLKNQEVELGAVYTIFNYKKGKLSSEKKKVSGGLVEWQGRLRVIKHIKKKKYLAEVIHTNDLVFVGSNLSQEKILNAELPMETRHVGEVMSKSKVKIVGADKHGGALVIGEHSIVYLRGGEKKGVNLNSVYPLHTNFGVGLVGKKGRHVSKLLGFIKIVKVNKYFSTGVVFNLSKAASTNDIVSIE